MSHSLAAQLEQIGLCAIPAQLDDFIARATKARWSAHQILEQVVQTESSERSRRSLERRLRISGIKSFKPIANFDWSWPTKIERDIIERALTLECQRPPLNFGTVDSEALRAEGVPLRIMVPTPGFRFHGGFGGGFNTTTTTGVPFRVGKADARADSGSFTRSTRNRGCCRAAV